MIHRLTAVVILVLALHSPGWAQSDFHIIAQIADGSFAGGSYYKTKFMIVPRFETHTPTCNIRFYGLQVQLGAETSDSFTVNFTADRSYYIEQTVAGQTIDTGYATVACDDEVFVQATYSSHTADGVKLGEATVSSTEGESNFETRFIVDGSEGARTGIAVANNSDFPRTYPIVFSHSDGVSVGALSLPARTSRAAFLHEMITFPPGASGVVEIGSPGVVHFGAVALRYTGPVFTSIAANPKGMPEDGGTSTPGQGLRPVVTGVGFNYPPPSGDTYGAGEAISIWISFSEPVSMDGDPRLALTIGTETRNATTYKDTAPRALRSFSYTMQSDDRDEDGISIAANALSLNGATIRSAGGADADLNLGVHAFHNDPSRKVDGSQGGGTGGNGGGTGGTGGGGGSELLGDGYTVYYDEGYRADAEFARGVLNPAATRFRTRYGSSDTPVEIHLLAEPTTVGGTRIQPGTALASGGPSHLAIYLMSRSAPAMQGACCNGLGLRFTDGGYQRTVLVHEFSTAFQHHYPGYNKWSGWFVQGLQQYEGLTAAGSSNLWQRTAEKVFRDGTVSCSGRNGGNERLAVTEVYWAGALVLRYLADRFGEASHIRILDSARSTLTEAIADEQPSGETPCELFDDFRNWMYEEHGLGEPE